ncbi:MAG: DsrE family protein [Planctomycetes bacterium]|nr:DsrE family protein [Planctomycetota bacterium]
MRRVEFQLRPAIIVLALAIPITGFLVAQAQPPKAPTQNAQHVLIHMKEYIAEIHETQMGLELADRLLRSGVKVTMWLELRAVRMADNRIVRPAAPGSGARPFSDIFKSLIEQGGQVLVCRHCAGLEEVGEEHLREGARLVGVDDVAKAIIEADKIVDY